MARREFILGVNRLTALDTTLCPTFGAFQVVTISVSRRHAINMGSDAIRCKQRLRARKALDFKLTHYPGPLLFDDKPRGGVEWGMANIYDFTNRRMERIAAFRDAWLTAHRQDPESYPLDMNGAEWDDALDEWDGEPFPIVGSLTVEPHIL